MFYNYIYLNLNFKVGNYVWSSHKMYLFCYPKASFWKARVVSLVVIPLFAFFCPKVWDPICWEDIYVSFQPSFVSSVISDEPTCLAILRKIMASPIQNVTVAVAHWTKMVFYLVFAKWSHLISVFIHKTARYFKSSTKHSIWQLKERPLMTSHFWVGRQVRQLRMK